jgi:hypothetical protein
MNTKLQKEKFRFRLTFQKRIQYKRENVFDKKDLLFLWRFIWSNSNAQDQNPKNFKNTYNIVIEHT